MSSQDKIKDWLDSLERFKNFDEWLDFHEAHICYCLGLLSYFMKFFEKDFDIEKLISSFHVLELKTMAQIKIRDIKKRLISNSYFLRDYFSWQDCGVWNRTDMLLRIDMTWDGCYDALNELVFVKNIDSSAVKHDFELMREQHTKLQDYLLNRVNFTSKMP